jgi:hypothetical protein
MIPAGYMYKAVLQAPEWVKAPAAADVYSVSGCISRWFADYIPYWRHNGFWFFDQPEIIREIADEHAIDLSDKTLFYYEISEQEYHEDTGSWLPLPLDLPFPTNVQVPSDKQLAGYDVVTYSCGTSPECSPLSCNCLAPTVGVNHHCLVESLEKARASLEAQQFDDSEPGPFRILSVYTTPEP